MTIPHSRKEKFIKKALNIHSGRYGYDLVEYTDAVTPVKIICPNHGVFLQSPKQHLKTFGCRECSSERRGLSRRLTKQEFVRRCREVHGEQYGYEKVKYENTRSKIEIFCYSHMGYFVQKAGKHLSGQGCGICGGNHSYSTQEFSDNARRVHGDFYSYEKTCYKNTHEKVEIICPVHGSFYQAPCHHLNGRGCRRCYDDATKKRQTLDLQHVIDKSELVHGDSKFDFSNSVYRGSSEKMTVICRYHPNLPFKITPASLLCGRGCPYCANEIRSNSLSDATFFVDRDITLYHVEIFNSSVSFEKVGITSKTIDDRLSTLKYDGYDYNVIDIYTGSFNRVREIESKILSYLEKNGLRYKVSYLRNTRTKGWTECFQQGELDLNQFLIE